MKNIYTVPKQFESHAWINREKYDAMYAQSIKDPKTFWNEQGQCLDWIKPYTKVMDYSYDPQNLYIKWYEDGVLNACVNCLDRHLPQKKDRVALYWEGDNPDEKRTVTYQELYHMVCKFANGLKALGIKKGDFVTIYLPMIPEATAAMLACARIGAIHSVVFGGFSATALAQRIQDCNSKLIITVDEGYRRGKLVPFKGYVDEALEQEETQTVENVLVLKRSGNPISIKNGRDIWYHEHVQNLSQDDCPAEPMNAEDPLFILYTSGSTGRPKGVLHTTGGYLVYANLTFKYIFDYHESDLYWCCADIGWITGHTYGTYGPLSEGASMVMFEGVPDYPDASRYWQMVENYKVNIIYSSPTTIRSLMRHGQEPVKSHDRSSLRLLGTVGEPIDPTSWEWYHSVVGDDRCPIVDTWWQTETGGIMLAPLPGATDLKPGSATKPFFGVKPAIVDDNGKPVAPGETGNLVLLNSWPGQMRTVYGDHQRFVDTYFTKCPGAYFTDDRAVCDADDYFWINGRVGDVIKISGHRLGTAEIEGIMSEHHDVSESAVVAVPHDIKGSAIYLFVVPAQGVVPGDHLKEELRQWASKKIGPIAKPDVIQWAKGLPKTRSGKVMRRILRKIAHNELDDLGDTSTLADPEIVDDLIKNRVSY